MTDKIKIGEHEYGTEFAVHQSEDSYGWVFTGWIQDNLGNIVTKADSVAALNELAQLRQANKVLEEQREELKKEIQEAVEIIERLKPIVKTDFAWLQRNKPTKEAK